MSAVVEGIPIVSESVHCGGICRRRCYGYRKFLWSVCVCFLSSCISDRFLNVQIQRITGEDFSCVHVRTPNPGFDSSLVGEELLIAWDLPVERFCNTHTQLKIRLRFRTGKEQEQIVAIQKPKAVWRYPHIGVSYQENGQIEAYFVQILQNDRALTEQKHALWVEKIFFTELE